MIESLEAIDRSIVFAVNSWNSPFLDYFMWIVSGKLTWIPLYLLLLFLAYRRLDLRTFFMFIGFGIITIALADLISVHCFKNVFERYRPAHHAELTNILHFHQFENGDYYKGGMYGFISSHAANFSALALFIGLSLMKFYPKLIYWLIAIVVLVCYSRLYLGVHYLSDVIAGCIIGGAIGFITARIFARRFLV